MANKVTLEDLKFMAEQCGSYYFVEDFDDSWVTPELIEKALSYVPVIHKARLLLVVGVKREDYEKLQLPSWKGGYLKQDGVLISSALHNSIRHLAYRISMHAPKKPKNTQEDIVVCPHCGGTLKVKVSVRG